jgi:hypothetical protein
VRVVDSKPSEVINLPIFVGAAGEEERLARAGGSFDR